MYAYQEGPFQGVQASVIDVSSASSEEIIDIPNSAELSMLLDLVASGHDEQSVPNGMVPINSYEFPQYPSPDFARETDTPLLPRIFPYERVSRSLGFSGYDVHSLVISCGSIGTPSHFPSMPTPMFSSGGESNGAGTSSLHPVSMCTSGNWQPSDTQQYQLMSPLAAFALASSQPIQYRKPKCDVVGCNRNKQSNGLCIRHGGGKRCTIEGCTRNAQTMGLCKGHGGGTRCRVQGCNRGSQSLGLCRTHGGGKLCVHPGCKKGIQRNRRCSAHGGARVSSVEGCNRIEHGGDRRHQHQQPKAQ